MLTKEEAIKAYADLIQLRRSQVPTKTKPGEVEMHHVLPISCGGHDVSENRIALYAKEHFMAHVYLWVIHHDDEFHCKTMHALNMMVKGTLNGSRKELRDFILASEEYQKAREEFAQFTSETVGEKVSGEKNGAYGTVWISNLILEETCPWPKDLALPPCWQYGRIIDFSKRRMLLAESQMKEISRKQHSKTQKELKQTFFTAFYAFYLKHGYDALCAKFQLEISQSALDHLFKAHVKSYVGWNRWKYKKNAQ